MVWDRGGVDEASSEPGARIQLSHSSRFLERLPNIARFGPTAADRAERNHTSGDDVRLAADEQIFTMPEMHREQIAIH